MLLDILVLSFLCGCLLFGFWVNLCIAVRAIVFGFHKQVFVLHPKVSLLLFQGRIVPVKAYPSCPSICLLWFSVFLYLISLYN